MFRMKKALFFLLLITVLSCKKEGSRSFVKLEGIAFGTTFHITMEDDEKKVKETEIDSLIHVMNRSLSTYLPNSDISKINRGDTAVLVDELFQEVFDKSSRLFRETNGAFDPTIGTLVNAWGFGPGKRINQMEKKTVDSLLVYVGFDQLRLENHKVHKAHPETFIDFNANAKGFGVDLIGRYLELQGIENYLIEIGGEIRARGVNEAGQLWRIAIEQPNFDGSRSYQTIISLKNESIATSGNYRKFKIDSVSGEKFAHTIDTKTGYPSKSNLLSASVIGELDCADVDGYATAFMAMGLEKSQGFLKERPHLKAFFIYSDQEGDLKTYTTENLSLED
jgi:thiamine biosynthesis lipoprotein